MFRVNRQTDYAVRVLLALAKSPGIDRISTTQISEEMLIPGSFIARIVAKLAQHKLIETYPGRDGGIQLARPTTEITLKDVVEIFEGPIRLSECMLGEDECPFEDACMVRLRWERLQKVILQELASTTIFELAQEAPTQILITQIP